MSDESIRKLYRSESDRMIAGICGGLGRFFGIDSTLIRLLFILSIFLGGGGIFVYLIAIFIVPLESDRKDAAPKAR
jgi:phage shock protein C